MLFSLLDLVIRELSMGNGLYWEAMMPFAAKIGLYPNLRASIYSIVKEVY